MGYDMHIVQEKDQEEKDAIVAADAVLVALNQDPDLDVTDPARNTALTAYRQANRSYFRLNNAGMSYCREAMAQLGMVTNQDMPAFPRLEDFNLSEYPDNPADYDGEERAAVEATLTDTEKKFRIALRTVTDYEPQPVIGIPVKKLRSNDGWLVTPAQCAAAIERWEAVSKPDQATFEAKFMWWGRWIAFLSYAKDRGGFHVH